MTQLLPPTASSSEMMGLDEGGSKVGIGLMVGGGLALIAGAILYFWPRRSELGQVTVVTPPVHAGGMTLTHYRDKKLSINDRLRILQDLTWQSVQDPRNRKLALGLTRNCPDRDEKCEARAIYDAIKKRVRYTGDVAPVAHGSEGPVEGIDLFQSAFRTWEFEGGDCLPAGTLLLIEGHRLVPIEDVLPGSKIWGRDRWSSVKNVWYKGTLPIDAIQLNNGSWLKATPEHKVYVAICDRHSATRECGPCSCPVEERTIERLPISSLVEGMVLVTPDRIPFGSEKFSPDRAYVEGLYLADGWRSHDFDFDISGLDGHPKEAQKEQVKEICERLGINTTWFKKSIRVRDTEWSRRVQLMGEHAPAKHALSIDLDAGAASALLRGIMADSGANTHGNGRTFTSTSYRLALQTRLLWKMFGVTCSERFIEDHGGLGQNPIWRLGVRQRRPNGKREKLLRVKTIERTVDRVPVWDISTDDHYVYLPQTDVVVSNCDDHSVLAATLLSLNGIPAKFRVTATKKGQDFSHIYPMAGQPKMRPTRWTALDTTLPGDRFGYEVPFAKKQDYPA